MYNIYRYYTFIYFTFNFLKEKKKSQKYLIDPKWPLNVNHIMAFANGSLFLLNLPQSIAASLSLCHMTK